MTRDHYQPMPGADEQIDYDDQAAAPQGYHRREPQFDDAYQQPHDTDPYRHQRHEADPFRMTQDDRAYAAPAHDPRAPQEEPFFEDGAPFGPQDDEGYDDPPRVRRHGGLLTAVTLIACAMIGTAGAYGYRTYYVGLTASRTPPTIAAETAPNKVVSAGDVQTGKSFQDRVREPGQNERMVSREEQPVEIRTPGAASSPRVVLPAPVAPSQSVFPPPPAAAQSPSAAPPAAPAQSGAIPGGGDAKRVRTVTIRPDGNDLNGRPVGGITQEPSAGAAPRTGSAKSTPPATRTGSNPISLDPQASAAAQPPASQAPAQPPAPRVASAQSNDLATGTTGGRAVQVSSQTSEAEAQASLRALQGKYPSQLGGHATFVRRVDLGAKGIYYRAMIGPFASVSEARQFCVDFKSAGGQCVVPPN